MCRVRLSAVEGSGGHPAANRTTAGLCAARRPAGCGQRRFRVSSDDNFTEILKGDLQPGDQVDHRRRRQSSERPRQCCRRASEWAGRCRMSSPQQGSPSSMSSTSTRTFIVGDVKVEALRGVSLLVEARRVRRHHGLVGLGQVDADEYSRLPRPADQRPLLFRGRRCRRLCASPTSPASAANGSASSSRASTCWPAPAPSRMSGCRSTTPRPGRRAARCASNGRARRCGLLGLGERERNTPGQLSGGQQQRVAIARALINAPSLLLADEPTGNLDTRTSHEIMETLVSLNREQGVTIVLVTHEADIAAYADRIVTMRDGEIVSDEQVAQPAVAGSGRPRSPRVGDLPAAGAARSGAADRRVPLALRLMILAAAAQAIGRNKMRSALTMLGVFIGVAALIVMVAVGQGANEAVRKQIESLGTNVVVILPGALDHRRHSRRLRQRHHAHGRGCARDPPRGSGGRAGRLSHPPAGPGAIRQPELDHDHPRREPQLSVDHQLADRRRPRHQPPKTRARPTSSSSSARRSTASCSPPAKIRSAPSSRSRACRCA